MPTKKTTRPERPRRPVNNPTATNRPSTQRPSAARSGATGPANRPPQKTDYWKAIRENLGWGLVIGLPIILVVLALLFRATNGFDFKPQPTPFPTIAPSPTAGVFEAPAAPPANAPRNRILYLAAPDAGKANQIFTANPDGGDAQQLTFTQEYKSSPVWSPDGKQIAFTASGVGIQLINWDGKGLHTLAYNSFAPVWSPDSKQIAFLRQEAATDGRGPDGSGSVRFLYVTPASAKAGDEKQVAYDALGPVWSPNNQDITYFSLRNLVMFTVRASGGKPTQLKVPAGVGGWFPTFTADGNSVVFYGSQNASYLADSLNQNVTFLTPTPTTAPTFTPLPNTTPTTPAPTSTAAVTATGTALGSPTPVGGFVVSLYQVNLDGSNFKALTELENNNGQNISSYLAAFINNSGEISPAAGTRPFYDVAPLVSTDSKKVAVLATNKEVSSLVIVTLDGSTPPVKIGDGLEAGLRLNPVFTSDGQKVVYLFQPNDRGRKLSLKVFDLNAKTEANFAPEGALSFPGCCGYKK